MGNLFEFVVTWFEGLHSFFQNICAAAAFAMVSWLVRIVTGKVKKSGSEFFVQYQRVEMYKHWLHKELVNSTNLVLSLKGYFVITLEAFRWAFRAALILIFFLGVSAIMEGNWLMLICYWMLLNCMLEGSTWLKDKSSESEISGVSQEIKDEFYERLRSRKAVQQQPDAQLKNGEAEAEPAN